MPNLLSVSRYIAVAAPSDETTKEWRKTRPHWDPPPTHKDYALMKVLSMLRMKTKTSRYRVRPFKWGTSLTPLDFSDLEASDVIFIVGHGDAGGLYALGPNAGQNTDRLVEILTKDGNLKAKRKDKDLTILLLSCRAGLGLHKVVANKLFISLGRDLNVGGAIGFTFGSQRTIYTTMNEVLIKGLPWFIEYPDSYKNDPTEAEKETSKREGKTITYAAKKEDIKKFNAKKIEMEDGLKEIVKKLTSNEVNGALDEIEKGSNAKWLALIRSQFLLYALAKTKENLEFDMWHDPIVDGYVWTTGKGVTAAQLAASLGIPLEPLTDGGTSVK
jgi:hypothetical protein